MRKANKLVLLLAAIVIASFVTSCTSAGSQNSDFYGKYSYCGEVSGVTSTVVLNEDGTFVFTFSETSSYLGAGKYTVKGDTVMLKTDDGKYRYTFKLHDGTLIFDGKNSSDQTWLGEFSDGSVFE